MVTRQAGSDAVWVRASVALLLAALIAAFLAPGSALSLDSNGGLLLVSYSDDATGTSSGAFTPDITPDGRYVVFATNDPLVEDDENFASDIYRWDRNTDAIELVTVRCHVPVDEGDNRDTDCWSFGVADDLDATNPSISADGSRIAFDTASEDFLEFSEDQNGVVDVIVRDMSSEAYAWASQPDSNGTAEGGRLSRISSDGRHVAFIGSSGLTGGNPGYPGGNVYLWEEGEVFSDGFLELVTDYPCYDAEGEWECDFGSALGRPDLSADGDSVVYRVSESDGEGEDPPQMWLSDLSNEYDTIESRTADGAFMNGGADEVAISDDGQMMLFTTRSSNADPAPRPGSSQAYLRQPFSGGGKFGLTELISVDDVGEPADGDVYAPQLSPNGVWATFTSSAPNLNTPPSECEDCGQNVFIVSTGTFQPLLASPSTSGEAATDTYALQTAVSNDGLVAFDASGSELTDDEDFFSTQVYTTDTGGSSPSPPPPPPPPPPMPHLSVEPERVPFSGVTIGDQRTATITVTSDGPAAASISDVLIEGADAFAVDDTDCGDAALPAGARCEVVVSFAPESVDSFSADLVIRSDAVEDPLLVELSGDGRRPQVSVTPTSIDFGEGPIDQTTEPATATVSNDGPDRVEIDAIRLVGDDASAFELATTCDGRLERAATCTLEVEFTPERSGTHLAAVDIAIVGGTRRLRVTLAGAGAAAELAALPSSLDFEEVSIGVTSAAQQLALENATQGETGRLSIRLAGPDADRFAISGEEDCAEGLGPQDTCQLSVRFRPEEPGVFRATLIVRAADGAEVRIPLVGRGVTQLLEVRPPQIAFPDTLIGEQTTRFITLAGRGQEPVDVDDVLLASDLTGSFAIDEARSTCAAASPLIRGERCSIAVVFAPTDEVSHTASVVISHSAGPSDFVSVEGRGTSVVVSADPTLGPPGFVPLLTGAGFAPGAEVVVRWEPGINRRTVIADADGRFELRLLVLHTSMIGPREAVATSGSVEARSDFLVVPGTLQAPDFQDRR